MCFLDNLCRIGVLKGKISKIIKGVKMASKVALPYLNLNLNEEMISAAEDIVKKYSENLDYILILDDLERCDIETNQLLGYINGLVEHNGFKVILVGNENEFKSHLIQNEDDKEIKAYKKIKEKLIGLTLKYRPNISEDFDSILQEKIKNKIAQENIRKNKDNLIEILVQNNHLNLRTLSFAFIAYEKIQNIIDTSDKYTEEVIDAINKKLLMYILIASIKIKLGEPLIEWKDSSQIKRFRTFEGVNSQTFMTYKFVDGYLLTGYLNKDECVECIKSEFEETYDFFEKRKKNEEEKKLSFYKLAKWYELEDDEVKKWLDELIKELREKKYTTKYFKDIINILFELDRVKFPDIPSFEKYTQYMRDVLIEENFTSLEYFNMWSSDEKYHKLVEPLIATIIDNKKNLNKETYITINDFSDDFLEVCKRGSQAFSTKGAFLSLFDISSILNKLKDNNTTSKEIGDFLEGIKTIYNFSNLQDIFRADINTIEKLINEINIEEFSNGRVTKKVGLEKVVDKLKEINQVLS